MQTLEQNRMINEKCKISTFQINNVTRCLIQIMERFIRLVDTLAIEPFIPAFLVRFVGSSFLISATFTMSGSICFKPMEKVFIALAFLGWEIIGAEERVCQASGKWSNQEPFCKKKGEIKQSSLKH